MSRSPSRLCGEADLVRGQQTIHRAGTKSLKIQGDKLKTQGFKNPGEFGGHVQRQGARHLFAVDLNANDVTMMTHAELAETQEPQLIFALLDGPQRLPGHWASI